MKTLVTGAAGFIGFHVARALLERGQEVIGIDNLNPYYDVSLKRGRLELITPNPLFTFYHGDINDLATLETIFANHSIDRICNLAAQAGVRHSIQNPFIYEESNLKGFLNLLEIARHSPVRNFVFASSSSVYGNNRKLPFSIDDTVDTPISLYAATKKANELMAHAYSHLFGLRTVGLRFFTVYGPWGRPDMAMWLFAEAMLAGRPIKVFNYGRMQRDFTYIDDIVQGVLAALMVPDLEPYEIINLGNHRAEELLRVISILETELQVKAEQNLMPIQPGDVPATYADITRARDKLGFQPTTPIEAGIPRFVKWYLDYRGRARG